MIAIVVVLLVLLFSLRGLAGFYTDYLWFDSLGQGGTFSSLLGAKIVPALVFTAAFFVIMMVNLVLADRLAPKLRQLGPATPEDELVARYRQTTTRYTGRIRVAVALFFALIAGIGVSSQWRQWILFTNKVEFHRTDPQFHKDIGFYVFQLPFINFLIDWLFAGLVIVLLVTAVAHYLNGGIRFQSPLQHVTPQVKAHLSVILAVMALVKTADYYFSRFELNFSTRGVVDGASYTDVHAQLPALNFLIFVSVIAAGLFLWNIWRRGWVLPVIAVGLWAFVSLVVGTIYPALIQNFKVKPNEFANERPYIRRNIVATRDAFDLESVDVKQFPFNPSPAPATILSNVATIDNARLWDPTVIRATYQTLQGLQTYYKINDVDIDRYVVDGQVRQVLISARDLNSSELPQQSWVNEHLVYTHGYGAVASPSNEAQADGAPSFFLSNIPTRDNGIAMSPKGSEVYFGEGLSEYVIVGAKQPEFNYPRAGARDATTRYDGKDGVELSNVIRKAAFALRFGDPNPLISGQVTGKSKVLMVRNVKDRVEKLAPFLDFDNDPYPAVVDGKLLWILDGYTTSDQYPYSQTAQGVQGLTGDFNYVRNSVKATVDAYQGTVKLYVIDEKDPIVRAYAKAFPDLFTPGSAMPAEIRAHLRYPEDLFKVQSDVFTKYHVTEPRRFYQGSERWLLTPDPNAAVGVLTDAGPSGTRATNTNRSPEITAETQRQEPYYLYIRTPGDDRESFLILQPFVPVSKDNQQTRLISFLTAKSDPRNYGRLESFVMPQGRTVSGPVQVANSIQSDPTISAQFTLLSQGGSSLVHGNIQLIPVGDSIVYVQPIFVQQSGSNGFPQFRFVVVFTQDKDPVIGSTVREGLNTLFGLAPASPSSPTSPTTPTAPDSSTAAELIQQAMQKFTAADVALKAGDLGEYQRLEKEARDLIDRAGRLLAAGGGSGGSGSTTTTSTTSPSSDAATLTRPGSP
jgi:uncharacterized membrane protein (UPF0182 family)